MPDLFIARVSISAIFSRRILASFDNVAQTNGVTRKLKVRVVGVVLTVCALIAFCFFMDRPRRRTYQAYVALDGDEPWGPLYPPSARPPNFVVVYRTGHNGVVCFDTFHSKDFHDELLSKNGKSVTVEYDTWSEFGKVYGYNVHSVDGTVLANGFHVFQPENLGVNGVSSKGGGTASGDDCW